MLQTEEWDWPPPPRSRAQQLEGRIQAERIIVNPRRVPPRKRPLLNQAADGFSRAVFTIFRAVVAIALAGVLLASIGLIGAILRA